MPVVVAAEGGVMDAETLEALKGSIEKWEKIVAGTDKDRGRMNCPLCQLFHPAYMRRPAGGELCDGCPVKAASGRSFCCGTPYDCYVTAGGEDKTKAAQAELDFLRSLLPKESV